MRAACRHISASSANVGRSGGQRVIPKQCRKTHGFATQLDTYRRLRVGAVIALIEQQVQSTVHRGQSRAEILRSRQIEQLRGARQDFLGARDALFGRRRTTQEGVGYLTDTESAQDMQDQRNLRFLSESRIDTREHHAQLIVLYRMGPEGGFDRGTESPLRFQQAGYFGSERSCRSLPPQDIHRVVLGGGHQPGGRVVGHAVMFPHLQRPTKGVLHDIFRQCEIVKSKDASQGGDHAP